MDIPSCYGRGIYDYWKMKKDSIRILINGLINKDPILSIAGMVFTGINGMRDIYNISHERIDKAILPKDECNNCRHLKGCTTSAISLLGDEINEELKDLRVK